MLKPPLAITILPGIPGQAGRTVDDDRLPYPESTTDFSKSLRQHGIEVHFTEPREDRRYVGFKALEDWLPIIEVSKDLLIGVSGGLLVEMLKTYLGYGEDRGSNELGQSSSGSESDPPAEVRSPTPGTLLHVDWRVQDGERTSHFRADGDSEAVLRSLEEFERSIRDE